MGENMARPTLEEARRMKEMGIFDVGTTYLRVGITRKKKKHQFWDGYVPPEDRE